jgi:Mn2+/Fe2+ NRAMP family transporter
MTIIAGLIVAVVVAGVAGWRHSPRTRRPVLFAVALIVGLILFIALASVIQIYLFPLPPL